MTQRDTYYFETIKFISLQQKVPKEKRKGSIGSLCQKIILDI